MNYSEHKHNPALTIDSSAKIPVDIICKIMEAYYKGEISDKMIYLYLDRKFLSGNRAAESG